MHRIRGFRIRQKLLKLVSWGLHRRRKDSCYLRLNQPNYTTKAMSKLCGFARFLTKSVKVICFRQKSGSSYIRLGRKEKNMVPKGHLAVYVGEKEGHAHRVFVPVIYFNHPLFRDLLREAEKVFGFNYDGGIQVPCCISEFEKVETKINAVGGCCSGSKFRARRSQRLTY